MASSCRAGVLDPAKSCENLHYVTQDVFELWHSDPRMFEQTYMEGDGPAWAASLTAPASRAILEKPEGGTRKKPPATLAGRKCALMSSAEGVR